MSRLLRVRRFAHGVVSVCALLACLQLVAHAQLQQGTVDGTVVGPDGNPVDGAVVTLLDGLGAPLTSVVTQAGQFRLTNVAPGTYSLRADAPPLFIAIAADDGLFAGSGFGLVESWRKAGRPVEFHFYERGGHGFGMYPKPTTSTGWFDAFTRWMAMHGLMAPKPRSTAGAAR